MVESRTSRSMAATIADLADSRDWDYGQVWVDGFARGAGLGRGVTKLARYAEGGDAQPDADIERWLEVKTHLFGVLPGRCFWRAGRPMFLPPRMRLVNWVYYQKARLEERLARQKVQSFSSFYFFHNNIGDFYSVYRPPGFLAIQALLPLASAADTLPELLRLAQRVGATPVLCGMKRHRPDDFMLSFQGEGYSISLELPLQGRDRAELVAAMHRVFAYITESGGRINLSKDETVPREMFQTMYPRHAAFWTLKKAQDPDGIFMCDLARRLLV
jgi:FAD/FMN-containing dehydrogenase